MKISEIYNLNKSQFELDFVDIHTDRDIPIFLDPSFIHKWTDPFCTEASQTIDHFFQTVINLIKSDEIEHARELFSYLKEPKETFLGLSPTAKGTGVTVGNSNDIFNNILASDAVKSGLLQDLEDMKIFIPDFDKDRLSDMTTNIIRSMLIQYTIDQCNLHQIPLTNNAPTGYFWDTKESCWNQDYSQALITPNNKRILLVPKRIVTVSKKYTSQQFYQHYVLSFLQDFELDRNSSPLIKTYKKSKERYVTKKDITAHRNKGTKIELSQFASNHPQVFKKFKTDYMNSKEQPIKNTDLVDSEISINQVCDHLIDALLQTETGNSAASKYHSLASSILTILLYPNLFAPKSEERIHDGRKRIDILYANAATSGIFSFLSKHRNTSCQYVPVECKNYTKEVANPEFDQLSGRFSNSRGWVGLLTFRSTEDMDGLIQICRDTYIDDRGLIIPICDQDLIDGLNAYKNGGLEEFDKIISLRCRKIQTK